MFTDQNDSEDFFVDDDAKSSIDLFKKLDANKEAFYTGKIQANYTMNLGAGQSFMVFLSDENQEQLQIGPMDPLRRKYAKPPILSGERIIVPLKKHIDGHGKPYYVGELVQFGTYLDMGKGLFFTVFVSREGQEQIQIMPLKNKRKKLND